MLRQQGRQVNRERVERLMAAYGIQSRRGRRRVRTTIRDPHAQPATDLVNRSFGRDRLDELWLGDITCDLVDWSSFATHAEARAAVFDWIVWYDHERLHTSLQMQSPLEFEQSPKDQLLVA